MRFGVYISGPGIVGRLLVRERAPYPGESSFLVFNDEADAMICARALQEARPYHAVTTRPYVEGDENLGRDASTPDGVS